MRTIALAVATAAAILPAASAAAQIPGAHYTGTTQDGIPFAFDVSADGASVQNVVSSVTGYCSGQSGGSFQVYGFAPAMAFPIAGSTFAGKFDAPVTQEIDGSFPSPGQAAGKIIVRAGSFTFSGGLVSCYGEKTWTAATDAKAPSGGSGGAGGGETAPPTKPTAPTAPAGTAPAVDVSFPAGVKLVPSLGNGVIVGGTVSAPAQLKGSLTIDSATAKRYGLGKRKLVVSRNTVVTAAGEFGLEFKFTKKVARKLRKARKVTFTLKIITTGADGRAGTTTKKISLGR